MACSGLVDMLVLVDRHPGGVGAGWVRITGSWLEGLFVTCSSPVRVLLRSTCSGILALGTGQGGLCRPRASAGDCWSRKVRVAGGPVQDLFTPCSRLVGAALAAPMDASIRATGAAGIGPLSRLAAMVHDVRLVLKLEGQETERNGRRQTRQRRPMVTIKSPAPNWQRRWSPRSAPHGRGGKERWPSAAEQRGIMDIDLLVWLLTLLFPQLRPLLKGEKSRQQRKRAGVTKGPSRFRKRRGGVGISWCFSFEGRDPREGRERGHRLG
jgi:hypothetical protein